MFGREILPEFGDMKRWNGERDKAGRDGRKGRRRRGNENTEAGEHRYLEQWLESNLMEFNKIPYSEGENKQRTSSGLRKPHLAAAHGKQTWEFQLTAGSLCDCQNG